ncbi:MAG: hypothetical protein ACFFCS_05915 [Candidatus Hodarchaeota archaeon]
MKDRKGFLWEIIVALRLYIVVLLFLMPSVILLINLGYLQPLNLILMGISSFIIIKFVLFEPRKASRQVTWILAILAVIITALILLNFVTSTILNIIHGNLAAVALPLGISIASILYIVFIITGRRFEVLNAKLIDWKKGWVKRASKPRLKQYTLGICLVGWLSLSSILILSPYPVYSQDPPDTTEGQRIGIWVGSGMNLTNETMQKISDANIYLVTTIKTLTLGSQLEDWLNQCKSFDIEVHVSMSAIPEGDYKFVNLFTIERLTSDIETIIAWLNSSGFLGVPVTGIVYDMENVAGLNFFDYITNSTMNSKLSEFYSINEMFKQFNQHVIEDYNLSVQICGDLLQGLDLKDNDDEIVSMFGLLADEKATRSYMIYRKEVLANTYVLDCCRLFNEGDTIILNSWKFEGCVCWQDLDCVIEEARLVLGFPGKSLNLELWRMDNFLDSYGLQGLHDFIDAVTGDPSVWPRIHVQHEFAKSEFSDLLFFSYTLLDLYTPLIKLIFGVY